MTATGKSSFLFKGVWGWECLYQALMHLTYIDDLKSIKKKSEYKTSKEAQVVPAQTLLMAH